MDIYAKRTIHAKKVARCVNERKTQKSKLHKKAKIRHNYNTPQEGYSCDKYSY